MCSIFFNNFVYENTENLNKNQIKFPTKSRNPVKHDKTHLEGRLNKLFLSPEN